MSDEPRARQRHTTTEPLAPPVSVSLPRTVRARVDDLAARRRLARGVVLRECVERGLPEVARRLNQAPEASA